MKKLRIVDGYKIRNAVDVDFCMIGTHLPYSYIPKNEIWLEKIYLPEKEKILADFLKKRALMKKYGYEKAKKMIRPVSPNADVNEVKKRLLGQTGKIKIYLVRGALVRKNFDSFFTHGGHWLVYDYVPKNEIWIDDVVLTKERKYVQLHEAKEAELMKKGKEYNTAHDYALAYEKEARRRFDGATYVTDG